MEVMLIEAPAWMSSATTSTCPLPAANMRGVMPVPMCAMSGSASAARSRLTSRLLVADAF